MATSSSFNFTVTRDDIIKEAYEKIGVIDPTESPTADQVVGGARKLNLLAKAWMSKGLNLWRREEATLFMENDKQVYSLGATGDHWTAEINAVQAATTGITEMRVAGVSTNTTLEVDSTTGMAASDNIGVLMDDNTIHWTTIASVTDSDTVVLTTGLDAAAAIDNRVYHYTSKPQRPLRVLDAHRRDFNGNDTPMYKMADDEYQFLSKKNSKGSTNQWYYDPGRDTNGRLHLWVVASSVKDTVFLVYQRPVQDFDATADNPDFPVEWFRALILGLAYDLAPNNGIPVQERALLKIDRDEALADAMYWDEEDASVYFGVDSRNR